jgi:hypothetical protein
MTILSFYAYTYPSMDIPTPLFIYLSTYILSHDVLIKISHQTNTIFPPRTKVRKNRYPYKTNKSIRQSDRKNRYPDTRKNNRTDKVPPDYLSFLYKVLDSGQTNPSYRKQQNIDIKILTDKKTIVRPT